VARVFSRITSTPTRGASQIDVGAAQDIQRPIGERDGVGPRRAPCNQGLFLLVRQVLDFRQERPEDQVDEADNVAGPRCSDTGNSRACRATSAGGAYASPTAHRVTVNSVWGQPVGAIEIPTTCTVRSAHPKLLPGVAIDPSGRSR
jgi:hypothetical protein